MLNTTTPYVVDMLNASGSNMSNITYPEEDHGTQPEAYLVPIVFIMIFLVGVLGNGTLIFTVLRNKNMRNVPNIFIVSLALGDIMLILVSVPFTATIYTFPKWPFGTAMCKINEFLQSVSLGVSVFTLTALSGDRYIAIVKPMARYTGSATVRTCVGAALIWVLSILLAIPELFAARVENHYCMNLPGAWGDLYAKFHTCTRFLIYFLIPIFIIGGFYAMMARILISSSRHMPVEGQDASGQKRQIEARRKVATLVLAFVIVFVFCWLPRHIYLMWYHFDPNPYNLFWHVFKILGFCMCFINSCVNPVALYFLSRQFRKYFNKYLCCICGGKKVKYPDRSDTTLLTAKYKFSSTMHRNSGTCATNMTVLG